MDNVKIYMQSGLVLDVEVDMVDIDKAIDSSKSWIVFKNGKKLSLKHIEFIETIKKGDKE